MPFPPSFIASISQWLAEKTIILRTMADRALGSLPSGKRRIALAIAAGALALLLAIIGTALSLRSSPAREPSPASAAASSARLEPWRGSIPPGELFFPAEPDFLPGVLLQREQRSGWTLEDAAHFWHDPLTGGEQQWRDIIEETIDTLMENVP